MKINYLGHSSFRIKGKSNNGDQVTVVVDPFDPKSTGLTYPKQTADIVTISHHHPDHDFVEKVEKSGEKDLFIIDTPGEYEVCGLRIFGVHSFHDDKQGKKRGPNTIYIYDFEEARVAHLGDLGHELTADEMEELENIEILIVPVGGIYTIDPKIAMQVVESIEPMIVIPMHYKTDKHNDSFEKLATLEDFIKEAGVETKPETELNIKSKSDLPQVLTIVSLAN